MAQDDNYTKPNVKLNPFFPMVSVVTVDEN